MKPSSQETQIHLSPSFFPETGERLLVENEAFTVAAFRFPSGIEGLRAENRRGHIVILLWLGQMIWDAVFDGCRWGMKSGFRYPRKPASILDTYGAFAYHAGVLRNGTPSPQDTHPLHGEMPVQQMDSAYLAVGGSGDDAYLRVGGEVEYVKGFGPHYLACASVQLSARSGLLDVSMEVENLSSSPMELMYMLHANFAFVAGATIHQPAPYLPESTVVRQAVPSHVAPSPEFLALLDDLKEQPERMRQLDEPELYDPEQVFYVRKLKRNANGVTRLAMELPNGNAFSVAYRPQDFPHCVRWILNGGDAQVAAFALPSTCEPEGYTAEKAKGHVRMLDPGEKCRFPVRLGFLARSEAAAAIAEIQALDKD